MNWYYLFFNHTKSLDLFKDLKSSINGDFMTVLIKSDQNYFQIIRYNSSYGILFEATQEEILVIKLKYNLDCIEVHAEIVSEVIHHDRCKIDHELYNKLTKLFYFQQ